MRHVLCMMCVTTALLGCGGSSAPPSPAPVTDADLIFRWDDYFATNQLEDAEGNYIVCQAEPVGRAFFDVSGAMDGAGGGHRLDLVPRLSNAIIEHKAATIVMAVHPPSTPTRGAILTIGPNDATGILADGNNLKLSVNGLWVGSRPLNETGWTHVTVVLDWTDGQSARMYIDGQFAVGAAFGGSVIATAPVTIGSASDGTASWAGRVRDVRFYRGAMPSKQITAKHAAWRSALKSPTLPEPVDVQATLVDKSAVPGMDQMDTYRRALVGNVYETPDLGRIIVYQWAIMDMQPVERFAGLTEGRTYDLALTDYDANPQLEGELMTTDSDAFDLPIYYDAER